MHDVRRSRLLRLLVAPAAVAAVLAVSAPAVPASAATIPPSTRSAPYTYLVKQPRNAKLPVRWNPCVVHHYKIYGRGSTAAERTLMRGAVARLAKASGMTWVYSGLTAVVPNSGNASNLHRYAGAELVLALTRPGRGAGRSNLLPSSPTLLGVGGAYYTWQGTKPAWFVSGYALFDARHVPASSASRTRMFEHEVGHAFGLGHTNVRSDVMYPVQTPTSPVWSTGFAHGLIAIGRAAGCKV